MEVGGYWFKPKSKKINKIILKKRKKIIEEEKQKVKEVDAE